MNRTVIVLQVALLLWLGSLFALLGLQRFFVEPLASTAATVAVFMAQTLPLLVLLPVVLRGGARGPLWLCLVTPLYFAHGIWQWHTPAAHIFGIFEVVFALGGFATSWGLLKLLPRGSGITAP
jgi:uncharacterized membrane protein